MKTGFPPGGSKRSGQSKQNPDLHFILKIGYVHEYKVIFDIHLQAMDKVESSSDYFDR